jgi:hypothetical protein
MKRSTLIDFVALVIFAAGVLWVYYKTDVRWQYGEFVPVHVTFWGIFEPGIASFFFVWPFTSVCGLEALVVLFHLLKDGNVAHSGPSRIGVVFGLYIAGIALALLTSPIIFLLLDCKPIEMIYIMSAIFMMIYACLEGSSLFLRLINLRLEASDPGYKRWMEKGGDPVIDVLPGQGMGILGVVVCAGIALLILHYSTLWFCVFLVACGLLQLFNMIPRL